MIKLSDYIEESLITFLDAKSRDDAIKELVYLLAKEKKIFDHTAFLKAIMEREKVVSTGIGMGVAIPHAKMKNFERFFIAVGIQKGKGLNWESLDKGPVRLIFMIGGPENQQMCYLQLLSQLTNFIKDEKIRKKVFSYPSKKNIFEILKNL